MVPTGKAAAAWISLLTKVISSDQVKDKWSYMHTTPYAFIACIEIPVAVLLAEQTAKAIWLWFVPLRYIILNANEVLQSTKLFSVALIIKF